MQQRFPTLALTATLTAVAFLGAGCGDGDGATTAGDTASATPTGSGDTESGDTDSGDTESGATSSESSSGGQGDPLPRASDNITLAAPIEGAEVTGSFMASGKANSPEANVPWEITDSSGKLVKKGFATATGWMDKLYPWQVKVDVAGLEPGTYVFSAMTDDPSGGEGKAPEVVQATIVVR